jgi:hypothetical protein
MKNSILHVIKAFSACAVLGVSSLAAQSHNLVANVPFDFTVMNQHFAAGTYTVTSETSQSPILIRGRENGAAMFVLTLPATSGKTRADAKLVFDRFGSQYFLRNIWYAGTNEGQQLRISKAERELAQNSQKPEQTTLVVVNRKPDKPR